MQRIFSKNTIVHENNDRIDDSFIYGFSGRGEGNRTARKSFACIAMHTQMVDRCMPDTTHNERPTMTMKSQMIRFFLYSPVEWVPKQNDDKGILEVVVVVG